MPDRLADDSLVQRAPAVLSRRTLDGILVFTPEMSEVLQISTPGDLVWDLVAEPLVVTELVATLSRRFDVPEETISAQIRPVLDALLAGSAIVTITPG